MDDATHLDLANLVAAVPLDASAKHHAQILLQGADRFYHGVEHVALLWRRHRQHAKAAGLEGAREDRLIASAILFHDCVYVAGRTNNEELSAQAWLDACASSGLDEADRAWVAETIRATRDHLGYAASAHSKKRSDRLDALRLWMLDLDLTPLGEAADVFDHNAEQLRAEASHLDGAAVERGRLNLLRRFADAGVIYQTPALAARFDAPARRNLDRHLARVGFGL